jgi:hypothetical protein
MEQRTARNQNRGGNSFSKKVFPKGRAMKAWVKAEAIKKVFWVQCSMFRLSIL